MIVKTVSTASKTQNGSQTAIVKARLPESEAASQVCCNLDSLVQPHFFCGQLLTDQDLLTFLRWTQDKLRLNRYRDGWGVVCGLSIHCDPKRSERVIVGPGYAIDCCGDDIIVNQEVAIDLTEACRIKPQPCLSLNDGNGNNGNGERARDRAYQEQAPEYPNFLGDIGLTFDDIRRVDLYVRYHAVETDLQTALGRSACNEVGECAYSRTRESFDFTLCYDSGLDEPDEAAAAWERWCEGYHECALVVDKYRARFPNGTGTEREILEWLLGWIDRNPLHQFCFIRDWLCDPERESLDEATIAQILYLMVLDCRNAYLSQDCHACQSNKGVRLARVWLNVTEERGRRVCRVLHIDAYPPNRRLLGVDSLPVPDGQINLAPVIWRRWPEAQASLAQLGFCVEREDPDDQVPTTLTELTDLLLPCDELSASCGDSLTVKVLDIQGVKRVVGFSKSTGDDRMPVDRPTRPAIEQTAQPNRPTVPEPELPKVAEYDDLTQISGIGGSRQEVLYEHGITTYTALMDTPNARLKEILPAVGEDRFTFWKAQAHGKAAG